MAAPDWVQPTILGFSLVANVVLGVLTYRLTRKRDDSDLEIKRDKNYREAIDWAASKGQEVMTLTQEADRIRVENTRLTTENAGLSKRTTDAEHAAAEAHKRASVVQDEVLASRSSEVLATSVKTTQRAMLIALGWIVQQYGHEERRQKEALVELSRTLRAVEEKVGHLGAMERGLIHELVLVANEAARHSLLVAESGFKQGAFALTTLGVVASEQRRLGGTLDEAAWADIASRFAEGGTVEELEAVARDYMTQRIEAARRSALSAPLEPKRMLGA
jgi:hypothetical protein